MDVQGGFILGIYNDCDRWCERCPLTSRCRAFADRAELEATQDPTMQEIAEAPLLPQDRFTAPSRDWQQTPQTGATGRRITTARPRLRCWASSDRTRHGSSWRIAASPRRQRSYRSSRT